MIGSFSVAEMDPALRKVEKKRRKKHTEPDYTRLKHKTNNTGTPGVGVN